MTHELGLTWRLAICLLGQWPWNIRVVFCKGSLLISFILHVWEEQMTNSAVFQPTVATSAEQTFVPCLEINADSVIQSASN